MIKRIIIPDPITLIKYCDKNDLTIIITRYRNEFGNQFVRAEIQDSSHHEINGTEFMALIKLSEFLNNKTIVINGKIHKFPILRCY